MTGKFITLEGPEGSGKTTVSKELVKILNESGYKVLLTREPGGVDIAEQIRNVILDKKNTKNGCTYRSFIICSSKKTTSCRKSITSFKRRVYCIM